LIADEFATHRGGLAVWAQLVPDDEIHGDVQDSQACREHDRSQALAVSREQMADPLEITSCPAPSMVDFMA
jgi:hypothetical protein